MKRRNFLHLLSSAPVFGPLILRAALRPQRVRTVADLKSLLAKQWKMVPPDVAISDIERRMLTPEGIDQQVAQRAAVTHSLRDDGHVATGAQASEYGLVEYLVIERVVLNLRKKIGVIPAYYHDGELRVPEIAYNDPRPEVPYKPGYVHATPPGLDYHVYGCLIHYQSEKLYGLCSKCGQSDLPNHDCQRFRINERVNKRIDKSAQLFGGLIKPLSEEQQRALAGLDQDQLRHDRFSNLFSGRTRTMRN